MAALGLQRRRRQARAHFEPEETAAQELEEIEKQVVQLLSQQSQSDTKIFGKALAPPRGGGPPAELPEDQRPREQFPQVYKLNWDRVRVWDASGQELQEFGDLAGRSCKVRVEMRQCWLMPPSWGILRRYCRGLELGAGGASRADVQVAQLEVRAGGVAQVHPAPQREALAAGVGDGVAEPRVAQELCVGEALPGFERHGVGARLEAQPRPDPHRLRLVPATARPS